MISRPRHESTLEVPLEVEELPAMTHVEPPGDWQSGPLKVVVNDEGQYSVYPLGRKAPPGWREAGRSGTLKECLDFIEATWTDLRPASLRRRMADSDPGPGLDPKIDCDPEDEPDTPGAPGVPEDDLVRRLMTVQPVTLAGPTESIEDVLRNGVVYVRFDATETEIGFRIAGADDAAARLESGAWPIRLAGTLVLDAVPVRCIAEFEQPGREGRGWLEVVGGREDRPGAG